RDTYLAAQVEEIVLDRRERGTHVARDALGQHAADGAVQLVDLAHGPYARRVLLHARAVAQARGPVVTGPRHDLAQPSRHGGILKLDTQTQSLRRVTRDSDIGSRRRIRYHEPTTRTFVSSGVPCASVVSFRLLEFAPMKTSFLDFEQPIAELE